MSEDDRTAESERFREWLDGLEASERQQGLCMCAHCRADRAGQAWGLQRLARYCLAWPGELTDLG